MSAERNIFGLPSAEKGAQHAQLYRTKDGGALSLASQHLALG